MAYTYLRVLISACLYRVVQLKHQRHIFRQVEPFSNEQLNNHIQDACLMDRST